MMQRRKTPIPTDLFAGQEQRILAASTRAIATRDGKHSKQAILMNYLRITNYKKRKRLNLDELIAAERRKTKLSVIILENISRALAAKKESKQKEFRAIKFSLGKIKPFKAQIARWEKQTLALGKNYHMEHGRFEMYRLLKLDPMDIFRAEIYRMSSKTKTNSRSPIPQQESIIEKAAQNAIRFA